MKLVCINEVRYLSAKQLYTSSMILFYNLFLYNIIINSWTQKRQLDNSCFSKQWLKIWG